MFWGKKLKQIKYNHYYFQFVWLRTKKFDDVNIDWKINENFQKINHRLEVVYFFQSFIGYFHILKKTKTAKNLVQDVQDEFPVLKAPTLSAPRSWIIFPSYCILCIFPLYRFQIGVKLNISQSAVGKFSVSPDLNLFSLPDQIQLLQQFSHCIISLLVNFKAPSSSRSKSKQRTFIFSESTLISSLLSSFYLPSVSNWLRSSSRLII